MLRDDGSFDRGAVMREAHRQYRSTRALGWSFGRCLSFAWSKARAMREIQLAQLAPNDAAQLPIAA